MRRIDAANQPLRRRFLIAGGAVELPCAEQTRNILEFQRQFQLCCINAVIFNGIGKARNLAMLQTGNRAVHSNLHILRQRGAHALNIHLLGIFSFGLYEKLMAFLIRKAHHLILDGRTIARACSLNHTAEHRRAVEVIPNNLMCFFVGIGQPAKNLRLRNILCCMRKGKRHDIFISVLRLHFL